MIWYEDIYLAFGHHKPMKWGNLLHFDAQRVPWIHLEREESVLGNRPRRDGVAGGEKSAAGVGDGAVGVFDCEIRVWRRRRRRGWVLRRERARGVWEWERRRQRWLEEDAVGVRDIWERRLLEEVVVRVCRLLRRRRVSIAAAELERVAVHSREK